MAIKIPSNKIQFKYTSGGEYIVEKTYQKYQGYYYELNGKTFAGQSFDVNAPVLLKTNSDEINSLLLNPKTALYGAISGIKLPSDTVPTYTYIPTDADIENNQATRYFAKKINSNPILIREINEETYNKVIKELFSSFQVIAIPYTFTPGFSKGLPQDITSAEKEMSGITAWLGLEENIFK